MGMEKSVKLQRKAIDTTFDAVVAGGGLSGILAALAAARENKKVILIEKLGYLGGMATAGLISPFMNYCERNSQTVANAGLFSSLLKRMYDIGALETPTSRTFREQLLKIVLDKMLKESDVKVLLHAYLSAVNCENGTVRSVTVSTVSGDIEIRGKYFIDATGDGNLFALAGMEFYLRNGPEDFSQPMTTCFNVINADWDKFDLAKMNELYARYQSEGKIKNPRENILVFSSPIKHLMHFNTTRVVKKDPCDVEDLTEAEMIGREQVYEIFNFLKDHADGMQDIELINIADEIGVRESRRVRGLYQLTEEDLLSTRKFEDSVARGTYDIDIHNPNGTGTKIKHIPPNDYYTVPYRCLVPYKSKNLLVAGRAISSTHQAHSSVRVMPITSCIGEAAGIAAALACETGCEIKDVPVARLHAALDKYGGLY